MHLEVTATNTVDKGTFLPSPERDLVISAPKYPLKASDGHPGMLSAKKYLPSDLMNFLIF